MRKQKINRSINRGIKATLDLSEAFFFGDPKYPLFRRQLMGQLNQLKRDLHHSVETNKHLYNHSDTLVTSSEHTVRQNPLAERGLRG